MIGGARILLAALAALTWSRGARADATESCLDSAARGQSLRDEHRLVEARDAFRACAQAVCPSVVQASCIEWLNDADRSVPSFVLGATDARGADLLDVEVAIDGVRVASHLDGRALLVDPGPHVVHFQLTDGTASDLRVLAREGAKDVPVVARFEPASARGTDAAGVRATPASGSAWLAPRAFAGIVLGGAGVVTMGIGAYFGVTALAKNGDASPYCGVGGVKDACYAPGASLRNEAIHDATASTALLLAGAAAASVGLVLLVTSPTRTTTVGFDGRVLHVGGTF